MEILAQCPVCSQVVKLTSEAIDTQVCCPRCRFTFKIPDKSEIRNGLNKIKDAKTSIVVDKSGNTYA